MESEVATSSLRFSVIVPVYNRSDLAKYAIESVLSQLTDADELIVVDDGSNTETVTFLQSLAEERDFQLLRQENAGPGVARNRGVKRARGAYLIFLDSDDLLLPGALAVYDQLIEQHQPALMAACAFFFKDKTELANLPEAELRVRDYPDYFASSRDECYIAGGWIVVRRDVFTVSGGFPDRNINAEDHDLILRLGIAERYLRITAPYTVGYRIHDANISNVHQKTLAGIQYLISQERQGNYPGGADRRSERRRIISKHARPVSIRCLQGKSYRAGWRLYRSLFFWNLLLGQWKYLFGFPLLWFVSILGVYPRKR